MNKLQINIEVEQFNDISELNKQQQRLIEEAKKAIRNAYAPFSLFNVAAAVLLENGEIITGTNQENAAFPSGLCAERVALFYANHKYPDVPVVAIAICAFSNNQFTNQPVTPCGSCRQVMIQTQERFKKPFEVIMYGAEQINIVKNSSFLLPLTFDSSNLNL